jgi:hypothetical protein
MHGIEQAESRAAIASPRFPSTALLLSVVCAFVGLAIAPAATD